MALYHNPEVSRTERRIQLSVINDTEVEVQVTEVLKNNTDQAQSIEYFYPLSLQATNPHLFVDALATPFTLYQGNERLNRLFDQATLHHDSRYLKLGSPLYHQLLISDGIILGPEEEIRLKIEWNMSSEFVNDFHFLEIFTDDDTPTEFSEIIFSLATIDPIWHFFTNIKGETMTEKDEHQVVMLAQKSNHSSHENLRIFWSHVENPTLQYRTDQTMYYGHFEPWDGDRHPQEIVFLVDTSGSMSDNVWHQTLKYLNFLLEKLEGTYVKILLADEDVRSYKDDFEMNNREFLRDFMEHTESLRPVGKSEILNALMSVGEDTWNAPKEERAIIVITDQILELPENIEEISAPVITLFFSEEAQGKAGLISSLTDGFSQRLFQSAHTLLEAPELWSKFQHWTHPKLRNSISLEPEETDLLPAKYTGTFAHESPLFIGRKFDSFETKYTVAADFLTRRWGGFRLAEILQTDAFDRSKAEALTSILKRFGIQLPWFEPQTPIEQVQIILQELPAEDRLAFVQSLKNAEPPLTPELRFHNSIPFSYDPVDFVWKSYDFDAKSTTGNLLPLAPFSPAQRQLFLLFPDLVATGFGIGEQTEFCTLFRCISVRYGHKELPTLEDRAFLSDFDPHHWVNPYLIKLVERGVFRPALNGKIHADRPIDRGEFLRMIFEIQRQNRQIDEYESEIPLFNDVELDSDYYPSVQYYTQQGVIKGYQDESFRPLSKLTRAEAVKILLSIQGIKPILLQGSEPIFADATTWERPWVEEAYHRGVVQGFSDGTFRPRDPLTRGSAVKLIVENFLQQKTKTSPLEKEGLGEIEASQETLLDQSIDLP